VINLGELRFIKEEEVELMRVWRNSPSVRNNMYTRHEISNDEHQAWWNRTLQRKDQQYWMYAQDNEPLGIVAFTSIDLINKNCSWAFYASPEAPRGTGSKMEFLALEHAFDNLMLYKLYCEVLAYNTPVIKLHQKFGFQIEGIFRKHHKVDEGYTDIYRLGIFSSDWKKNREMMLSKLVKK